MSTCFVIQPFDRDRFDQLFSDLYKPAIEAAGLTAYRVDHDPAVTVPIESIESEIRSASACLADITTDNPNVWYELGFATAVGRPVVMVCADDRNGRYPFDIQHRAVVGYQRRSPSDFERLGKTITARLKAALAKEQLVEKISERDPLASVAGLAHHELAVLAVVGAAVLSPDHTVPLTTVSNDADRAGVTRIGCSLAIQSLRGCSLLETSTDVDYNGNEYIAARVTAAGWEWLQKNQAMLQLQRGNPKPAAQDGFDDDIPF